MKHSLRIVLGSLPITKESTETNSIILQPNLTKINNILKLDTNPLISIIQTSNLQTLVSMELR